MSDHNKSKDEQAFLNWLEQSDQSSHITDPLKSEIHDKHWQQRLAVANTVKHQASMETNEKVPHWDRGEAFTSDKEPWWQWGGLPAISLAFSLFAVALVLFKVELVFQPEGMMLSFAGNPATKQAEEVSKLVDLKLREFAAEQQVVLANYATDFTNKQQESNLQLATYVIGAARQERKEDMNDFITYYNSQRKDESLNQKIKYQQLERKIDRQSYQSGNKSNQPDNLGYQVNPANWATEE